MALSICRLTRLSDLLSSRRAFRKRYRLTDKDLEKLRRFCSLFRRGMSFSSVKRAVEENDEAGTPSLGEKIHSAKWVWLAIDELAIAIRDRLFEMAQSGEASFSEDQDLEN